MPKGFFNNLLISGVPVLVRHRLRRTTIRLSILTQLAQKLLEAVGEAHAELSLELVGDGRMSRLNRTYRGGDGPTDVLAFPLRESPGPRSALLGDVVIAFPTAVRQAVSLGHSIDEELVRLLIHGLLHLLGYDHERGEHEARRMQRKEKALFRTLLPLPKLVSRG